MLITYDEINSVLVQNNIKINGSLHIGAHDCEELPFYNKLGLKNEDVLWMDAMPAKVAEARARGIPNVYHAVVTDEDDKDIVFNISNNGQSSSVLDFGTHSTEHPWVVYVDKIHQKTITINSFFERNNIDGSKYDFWNFDIQGAELMALKGATKYLQYAKALYLEVNEKELYKGCGLIGEIDEFLKGYNFKRVLTNITGHGWGDALYILDSQPTNLISSSADSALHLAYAFIGPLPHYAVDTVEQARKFFDGPIYFIVSDYNSKYIQILERKYAVNIIRYDECIDSGWDELLKETYNKFAIVDRLHGREKLFIYSFERFYILHTLMKNRNIQNVFFLELDNLIYDIPTKWLASFQKKDMAYLFEQEGRCSSGVCYIKNAEILKEFTDFCSEYIRKTTGLLQEMNALFHFWATSKERIQFLPTHWPSDDSPAKTSAEYHMYNNSIFDGAGLGIFIGGLDPYHTQGRIEKFKHKLQWYDIDYTKYSYEWRLDEEGRRIPYVFTGSEWIRINNLHIHSKDLRDNMS